MARIAIAAFIAILIPGEAVAQEFPKPTAEGKRELAQLFVACEDAGAVRRAEPSNKGQVTYTLADRAKLRTVVVARPAGLSPALRDALVAFTRDTGALEGAVAVALLRDLGEANNDGLAVAFADLFSGVIGDMQSNYRQAIQGYEAAARRFGRLQKPAWEALCLNNMGGFYDRQGDRARAMEFFNRALELWQKVHPESHPMIANCLNNIGLVYKEDGEWEKALEHLHKSLAIRRKLYGDRNPQTIPLLNNIGAVHGCRGEREKAIRFHQDALEICRKSYSYDHPDTALTLHNLAVQGEEQGKSARAMKHAQEALTIWRKVYGNTHPRVSDTLHVIGSLHHGQGAYNAALAVHTEALEIRRRCFGDRHPQAAHSLRHLGEVYVQLGELGWALDYYRRGLVIMTEVYGEEHPQVVTFLSGVANVHLLRRDLQASLDLYQRALRVARRVYGERHDLTVGILWEMGEALTQLGETDKALKLYEEALEVTRQNHGDQHHDVGNGWLQFGLLHDQRGEADKAGAYFGKAVTALRAAYGERHPAVAHALNQYGIFLMRQGMYTDASRAFNSALGALLIRPDAPREFSLDNFRPLTLTADVLFWRGYVTELAAGKALALEQLQTTDQFYQYSILMMERVRRQVIASDTAKLQFGVDRFAVYPRRVGVLRRLFEQDPDPAYMQLAFTTTELGIARVFLESLGRAHAEPRHGVSTDLRRQEMELLQMLRALDTRISNHQTESLDKRDPEVAAQLLDERNRVDGRLRALVARIEKEHPDYALLKYPRPCSLAECRSCLHPNEVALVYIAGPGASYLVLVEKESASGDRANGMAVYPLPSATSLEDTVAAVTDPDVLALPARARALGAIAYDALLAPVADRIRGKDLVIVPSGPLCFLPFELLVEGAEPASRYLVEGRRVRYAPSLTVLHLVRKWDQTRPKPDRLLWAVGDPVYGPDDERAAGGKPFPPRGSGRDQPKFSRLRFSGVELVDVVDALGVPRTDARTGLGASEVAVKAASEAGLLYRYRYVHFATHGILGLDAGRQPSLVLSLVGDGPEDGFLQLDEVTSLKLNADLVVLSACQTGQGVLHDGEGVRGLSRAFLYAGSRAVLCSLWKVDDRATARLMADMYRHIRDGRSVPDAHRDAQLDMIRAGHPPIHWAPFILIGE